MLQGTKSEKQEGWGNNSCVVKCLCCDWMRCHVGEPSCNCSWVNSRTLEDSETLSNLPSVKCWLRLWRLRACPLQRQLFGLWVELQTEAMLMLMILNIKFGSFLVC